MKENIINIASVSYHYEFLISEEKGFFYKLVQTKSAKYTSRKEMIKSVREINFDSKSESDLLLELLCHFCFEAYDLILVTSELRRKPEKVLVCALWEGGGGNGE